MALRTAAPRRQAGRTADIERYAAFSGDPAGGNPAGVVRDAAALSDAQMLGIAAGVGYSETAFVTEDRGGTYRVRYFSPLAEVPFCGHATVATAVAASPAYGSAGRPCRSRDRPADRLDAR